MSNNTHFAQLVHNALLTQGPERGPAEQELMNMKNSDYKNFLIESVKIIVDKDSQGSLRQAAGTLIKLSAAQFINQNQTNWDTVDEQIQNDAKNALLSTLIDQDPLARKAAADAISTICSIELPRSKWTELIESLNQNSSHQDVDIRKTAIMTLGYICEKLKDSQQVGQSFQLQDNVLENILMGIINGMKADQQDIGIKNTSILALRNALGYLEIFLQKKQIRDFVLKQILDCTIHKEDDIKREALITLIEFCKFQYNNLEGYIQEIFNITQNHLTSRVEDINIPAIEVWSAISTEYLDRRERNAEVKVGSQPEFNQNYIQIVSVNLLQILLQNLLIKTDNDEEAESPIQVSSEQALCAIVEALEDACVDTFTTFISNTANNADWVYKQASCIAFGCLLECNVDGKMKDMLFAGLSVFVNMLKEQNLNLVFSATKFVSKAANLHPEVFLRHPSLNQDLQTIVATLQQKPEISRNVCWTICYLSEALKQNTESPLSMSITQVIEALMKNALRNDLHSTKDLSLIDCSFMGIMNLLHNSPNTQVSASYLNHAIQHFKQSYNEPLPRKDNIQSGILATMHASLLSIQEEVGNNNSQEINTMIQSIYDLIINHFQQKQDVDSDGLYVISALATCVKGRFSDYLDGVWPFLEHSLSKQIDGDLFKTAIGALADIARACEKSFTKHVSVIQKLIQCLNVPEFDRDLKLQVYVCLGDVILSCKESCAQFLPELQQTFKLGFAATVYLLQTQKPAEVDYAEQLQEKLVEAYTCMLHGINNESSNEDLIPGFTDLIQFLQFTCDKTYRPTIDYVRASLTLIIDIANFYGNKVAHLVKIPFTQELIQTLQKFNNIPENGQILQYATKIYESL